MLVQKVWRLVCPPLKKGHEWRYEVSDVEDAAAQLGVAYLTREGEPGSTAEVLFPRKQDAEMVAKKLTIDWRHVQDKAGKDTWEIVSDRVRYREDEDE